MGGRAFLVFLVPATALLAPAVRCGGEGPSDAPPDGSRGGDGAPDVPGNDAVDTNDGNDADDVRDAVDADLDGYHDMTSTSFWSTFDLTTVNANARGFAGAAFDGRLCISSRGPTAAPWTAS